MPLVINSLTGVRTHTGTDRCVQTHTHTHADADTHTHTHTHRHTFQIKVNQACMQLEGT